MGKYGRLGEAPIQRLARRMEGDCVMTDSR